MNTPNKTSGGSKSSPGNNGASTDQGNKDQVGPDRMSPELDQAGKWDEVAADDGFQQGDQGGYKGSYDETKYQGIADSDMNLGRARGDAAGGHGDDDGKKTPMKQGAGVVDDRARDSSKKA